MQEPIENQRKTAVKLINFKKKQIEKLHLQEKLDEYEEETEDTWVENRNKS